MGFVEKLVNRIGVWGTVLGMVFICVVTLIIGAQVLGRFLYFSLPGTYDLVETLVVVGVAFTLVYTEIGQKHTRAEILVDHLHGRTKAAFEAVTTLISCFIWGVLTYAGWLTFARKFVEGEETEILKISVVPFRGIWVFVTVLMCLMLFLKFLRHLKVVVKGDGGKK